MSREPIRSRDNRWIKRVKKALVRHDTEIVLEGPRMIRDAITHGWEPIITLQEEDSAIGEIEGQTVDRALFREISDTRTSQGLVALFERPVASDESAIIRPPARSVVLDAVQDPGNVGTIIRLAAAFDLSAVVRLEGTADPWSPKALRASAGAALLVPILDSTRERIVELAREHDLEILVADSRGSDSDLSRTTDLLLVLGNEGRGASKRWADVSRGIRIPTSDRVESLNVAAAAAILLSRLYDHTGL